MMTPSAAQLFCSGVFDCTDMRRGQVTFMTDEALKALKEKQETYPPDVDICHGVYETAL